MGALATQPEIQAHHLLLHRLEPPQVGLLRDDAQVVPATSAERLAGTRGKLANRSQMSFTARTIVK